MHGVARPDLRTGAWTLRDHGSDRLVAVEIDDIVVGSVKNPKWLEGVNSLIKFLQIH